MVIIEPSCYTQIRIGTRPKHKTGHYDILFSNLWTFFNLSNVISDALSQTAIPTISFQEEIFQAR